MPIVLDLRQAILYKVHNKSLDELREMVEGSVDGPEQALPGLGVLFEWIWKNIDNTQQQELLQILDNHLKTLHPEPLK